VTTNDEIPGHKTKFVAMIDGKHVEYDMCSYDPAPDYDAYRLATYLGVGYVYSVNGIVQSREQRRYHFWRQP